MKSNRDNSMFMPYQGMPQTGMYPFMPGANNIDNRLDSIERQLRKLDARISRLEGTNTTYSGNDAYNTSLGDNFNQNMYPNSMHMM